MSALIPSRRAPFIAPRRVLIGLFAMSVAACGHKPPPAPPPPEVLVIEAKPQDVPIYHEYVGQLDASVNATIEARVQGYLLSQKYKEGQPVKKGDVLFEIDRRPFEAALAQAQAAYMQADASAKQAELNGQREVDLFQRKVASAQERDNAVQTATAARAQAEAQKAAVEQAQVNLDYTTISAPVDGIAGLAKAQVGDLVGAGTVLTSVTKVDPIKAYFTVSEQRYAEYAKQFANAEARAAHEKQLEFQLILADGSVYPQPGEMFASDNQVDIRTGSLRIAALFPNPNAMLRPGQFARIRVLSEVRRGAIVVPQRAVNQLQSVYQIAVVGPDNKASVRTAKVGPQVKSDWVIEDGLKAGERVVVDGFQKVRDGALVTPKPWTPPPGDDKAFSPPPVPTPPQAQSASPEPSGQPIPQSSAHESPTPAS